MHRLHLRSHSNDPEIHLPKGNILMAMTKPLVVVSVLLLLQAWRQCPLHVCKSPLATPARWLWLLYGHWTTFTMTSSLTQQMLTATVLRWLSLPSPAQVRSFNHNSRLSRVEPTYKGARTMPQNLPTMLCFTAQKKSSKIALVCSDSPLNQVPVQTELPICVVNVDPYALTRELRRDRG